MIFLKLFFAFAKISLFSFGGAYSFLPVIEKEIVERYGWLNKDEFLYVLGLVEVFPGAISIKYATYTGYKTGGVLGAILANLGNILPPALIVISAMYLWAGIKQIQWAKDAFGMIKISVIAMILAIAIKMIDPTVLFSTKGIVVSLGAFILFYFFKLHPAFVIILAAALGILLSK